MYKREKLARKKLHLTAVKILILLPILLDLMDELSSFYFIYLYIFVNAIFLLTAPSSLKAQLEKMRRDKILHSV